MIHHLKVSWEKRILSAIQRKSFTKDDKRLAELWINDPTSELCDIIKYKDGQIYKGPEDVYIRTNGLFFTKAVEEDDINLAISSIVSLANQVLKLYGINPWPKIKGK